MAGWVSPTGIHSACGHTSNAYAGRFIDGSLGTQWAHIANEIHWVVVDLGESKLVEQVRIYLASGNYGEKKWDGVDVYVSDDPADWGAAVATNLSFTNLGQWNQRDVTDKVGRYIKLADIDTRDGNNHLWGVEFEAYVSPPPPEAPPQGYSFIM